MTGKETGGDKEIFRPVPKRMAVAQEKKSKVWYTDPPLTLWIQAEQRTYGRDFYQMILACSNKAIHKTACPVGHTMIGESFFEVDS